MMMATHHDDLINFRKKRKHTHEFSGVLDDLSSVVEWFL